MGCSNSSIAPEAPTLPARSSSLPNWASLLKKDNPNNSNITTIVERMGGMEQNLNDYNIIASSLLKLQNTESFLSPTMRMQLWVAFSGINSISTQNNPLWNDGWYKRALSKADEMAVPSAADETTLMMTMFDASMNSTDAATKTLIVESVKSFKVIDNDVPRTLHNFVRFTYPSNEETLAPPPIGTEQVALTRVLRAFVATRPDINYTQGINFIAALLLRVLWYGGMQPSNQSSQNNSTQLGEQNDSNDSNDEREIVACGMLRIIANQMGLDEMWRVGFPFLHDISNKLMSVLAEKQPKLKHRLDKAGLPSSAFTTSWMITMFTSGDKFQPIELLKWWDHLWIRFVCNVVGNKVEDGESGDCCVVWETAEEKKMAVEEWLLKSMVTIMECHSIQIIKSKDTVSVMKELKRGLSKSETGKLFGM